MLDLLEQTIYKIFLAFLPQGSALGKRAALFSSSMNSSVEQTGPFCGDRALMNK